MRECKLKLCKIRKVKTGRTESVELVRVSRGLGTDMESVKPEGESRDLEDGISATVRTYTDLLGYFDMTEILFL